jgi:type III secretion system YscD/HrpQ family protein
LVKVREDIVNALLGDDAYALTEDASIELRILYGAQAGSRLCLSIGEYTLGCDDSCTLILEGSGIEDRHAILRFDGAIAWIDPVDGVVRNAHGDDIDDEQELTFGLPVELGNVWISVDREDAPWPDPRSVTPIDLRKSSDVEKSLTPNSSDEINAAIEDDTAARAEDPFVPPRRTWRPTYVLLFAIVLVAGGFGAFSLLQAYQAQPVIDVVSPAAGTVQAPPPQAALELIRDYPRTKLTLQHEQGQDRWVVSGYVAKTEQQRELGSMLASMAPTVQAKVFVEEELVQSARQVLAAEAASAHIGIENATGGVLQLTGAASSARDIQRMEEKLLAGVPGVSEVKSQVLLPEQLARVLRDRIAAASLRDRLAISSEAPEMRLAGRLTMEEIRRWEEIMVTFNREYGNVLPIRATVTRLVPKPPVGVQAIVGGTVPYIVTQAGEHVNQGGDVNGHTLISVKDGEVIFEGRQRVRIAR